ncbi:hypothetical protein K9M79_02370 [Candidatus Woesearchaeota archaeon]|nr:hypothetical protein [Candidatus Woesearchaeota archaeon]
MKKTIFLIALLMLAINIVVAQEDAIEEVSVMGTMEGATIRLLQLQSSIEHNILKGTDVISEILDADPEANFSRMEEILAEMDVLSSQIEDLINSDLNETKAAEEFVFVKIQAKELSKEFRTMAIGYLPDENQERVRNRNETSQDLTKLKEEIKQRTRAHNALQVQKFLDKIGLQNDSLVSQIGSGELNVGQAISSVAKAYKGLGQENKAEALAKIKEVKAKAQVQKETVREKTENSSDELKIRAQERKEAAKGKIEKIKEKIKSKHAENSNGQGSPDAGNEHGGVKGNSSNINSDDQGKNNQDSGNGQGGKK